MNNIITLIRILALAEEKCVAVAAGEYFSLVLTAKGEIFSFGRGDKGQLGHKKSNLVGYRALVPRKVEGGLIGQKVTKIACGHDHSMAVNGS